jgi:hypothetical protein
MKEQLEILSLVLGMAGTIIGGIWFIWNKRQSSIQDNYHTLAQTWTNEGAINNTESMFISLNLTLNNGELYGSLTSPQLERDYDVNVKPGWFSSIMTIGESYGRGVAIKAIVKVRIVGNRNRLKWQPIKVPPTYTLPNKTVLWLST